MKCIAVFPFNMEQAVFTKKKKLDEIYLIYMEHYHEMYHCAVSMKYISDIHGTYINVYRQNALKKTSWTHYRTKRPRWTSCL